MKHTKGFFILALGLVASVTASAQQANSASAQRAQNAALSLQLKQQKEAMEIVKQNLDALVAKVESPTEGLKAVRDKVNHSENGIDAIRKKVDNTETRPPQIAVRKISCSTSHTTGNCSVNCTTKNRGIKAPKYYLSRKYSKMGNIVALDSYVVTNPVTVASQHLVNGANYGINSEEYIETGYAVINNDGVSSTCYANKVGYCAKTKKVRVGKGGSKIICTTAATKYAPTTCKTLCATIGYLKQ